MKLNRARLCLNCEEVFEGGQCPGCGEKSYALLAKWLNRNRFVCAWCGRLYGEGEVPGTEGICPECKINVLAKILHWSGDREGS